MKKYKWHWNWFWNPSDWEFGKSERHWVDSPFGEEEEFGFVDYWFGPLVIGKKLKFNWEE